MPCIPDPSDEPSPILITGERYEARLALQGATLLDWCPRTPDGKLLSSVLDGYRDDAELTAQNGVRNGILVPFTNRIESGTYAFDGRSYRLDPIVAGEAEVYHGFARALPFRVTGIWNSADALSVELTARPGDAFAQGYPFKLDFRVRYDFRETGVDLSIAGINTGDAPAPFSCGWHSYFQIPGVSTIDDLSLCVPSSSVVETDTDLIPLRADGRVKLASEPAFATPEQIGKRQLDCCFANLHKQADGRILTTLEDRRSGRSVSVWQERGFMHVFTGDTLARDRRGSIALEPVETVTNAFNYDEYRQDLLLAPGEVRSFACGFTYSAGSDA